MKKEYIQPEMVIQVIQLGQVIAASVQGLSGVDGLTVGGDTESAEITTGNVRGRGYDVWADDWSE